VTFVCFVVFSIQQPRGEKPSVLFMPGRSFAGGAGLFALGLVLLGCQSQGGPSPGDNSAEKADPALLWFEDVTEKAGLHFMHDAGSSGDKYFMPRSVGSGVALFDFDNDGRLDILLLQNGGPGSKSTNRLFHQEKDGTFKDVSAGSGLDVAGYGMGMAIGDVNNDGWPDVLITEYGSIRLFLNNGNGTFTDVTRESGLSNSLWGTSVCFVDYDRDGWLDLVVVNYADYDPSRPCLNKGGKPDFCGPAEIPGTSPKLFRNLGRQPGGKAVGARTTGARFEDVTVTSGLAKVPGRGLGVVCADFDGDGWPDILIANDAQPNRLWINRHNGTFTEEALSRGLAYNSTGQAQGNMGIALGDVNGDGLFDIFIAHLHWETHTLWEQGPRGSFQDRTTHSRVMGTRWRGTGFGTVLADFDNHGALDLALVNGAVGRVKAEEGSGLDPFWAEYAQRNQLFRNDGTGRFLDVSASNLPFCGTAAVSRGLAWGDVDNDGGVDLLVTAIAGPARLFRNVAPNRGHWLLVRAFDPALKRDAYGAEVTVRAGGRRWVSWVNPGSSYLCSNDPRAHFGLGKADRVEAIEILWPDGRTEIFPGRQADQVVLLRRGEGQAK
jgi:hypothetical protein